MRNMAKNIVYLCICVCLCFVCVLCQLEEGSDCTGESDGFKGKCVDIRRCLSTVYDLKRRIHPQRCSFRGLSPIVCCTDCELVNDTSNVIVDETGSHYFKTGRKAADSDDSFDSVPGTLGDFIRNTFNNQLSQKLQNLPLYNFIRECLEHMVKLSYACATQLGVQREQQYGEECYIYQRPFVAAAVGGHDAHSGEYPHMFNPYLVSVSYDLLYTTLTRQNECLGYVISLDYPCRMRAAVLRQLSIDGTCYTYQTPIVLETVGGIDAYSGQYPHMALLGFGDDLPTAQWLCGGSVISDRFILTAAHCIASPALGSVKYVALGILKRTDPPEQWQRYQIKRIVAHPGYQAPLKYHDIALLETDTKIKFSKLVLPACLNTDSVTEEWATATGWGALGHRQMLADTLQVVNLQQYSKEECSAAFPPHRHLQNGYDHDTQTCYGDRTKITDTCEGDSGGPLQISSELGSCVYKIVGVTSYGRSCGFQGNSGMYTRVSYYVPWIESVVWP